MCVLQHKVDSTILVLKLFTNFTEGADSMKQVGMILVNRCAEIRNASLMAQPIMAETGRRVLESDAFSAGLSTGWVKLDCGCGLSHQGRQKSEEWNGKPRLECVDG